ncbi:MAG TPA: M20/M25/M40 family metallo-hydrolase [Vicinamibacteria bacterium]|nr:M20/M25/M40 family metallo-hydrolase [Vicinamibacteria bacterium]
MTARLPATVACAWLAAPLLGAAPPAAPEAAAVRAKVRAWREAQEPRILRELADLLALPNVAQKPDDIRRNADHILGLLRARGLRARLLEVAGGAPAVYGELAAREGAPTVLIYAHYDGQPVDPAQWTTPPWTPVLRDGPLEANGREVPLPSAPGQAGPEWRLYARSASDDKAPIVAVLAAVDALRAGGLPLTVNLKLFLEGEEEAGSPHLEAMLRAHASTLAADLWLLCDGPVHQTRRAQVFFGVRGVTGLEMTAYGPARALHSGHYGNWAPNPALTIAHAVASLRDETGRVLVDGYYDDVRPPTESERRAVAAAPPVERQLAAALSLSESPDGKSLAEGVLEPAINVRGLRAGGVGEQAANAIPTRAQASLDFRLVPDQTPAAVRAKVEAHLRRRGYRIVHAPPSAETRAEGPRLLYLQWEEGYPAARTSLDDPAAAALVRVIDEAVGGGLVVLPTLGGSVPMHRFAEATGAPIVGLPIANHDNNQHAADENLRLQNLWDGIELYAAVLARLGPGLAAARSR